MKRLLVFSLLLVLAFGLFSFAGAVDLSGIEDKLDEIGDVGDRVEDVGNTLSDSDRRSAYLRNEWTKMLEGTPLGNLLKQIEGFFVFLNPIFVPLLGLDFSWSWLFFITLVLFIIFLEWIYRIMIFVQYFFRNLRQYSFYLKVLAFLFVSFLVLALRIPKLVTMLIIAFVSGKGEWWIQLIAWAVVIIVIVVIGYVSKYLDRYYTAKGRLKKIKRLEKEVDYGKKMTKARKIRIQKIEKDLGGLKEKAQDKEEFDKLVEEYAEQIPKFDLEDFYYARDKNNDFSKFGKA